MIEKFYDSKDGVMRLVEVKSVYKRAYRMTYFIEIRLKGKRRFACTSYHEFVGIRDGIVMLMRGDELRAGDIFWLDIHAFGSDGSFVKCEKE